MKNLNVIILNVLLYDEKNKATGELTGKKKIRIGYLALGKERLQEKKKFKGYAELSYFLDYDEAFWNKITPKFIMQPCEFQFEERPSERYPLKTCLKLVSINCKDENISLV